MYFLSFAFLISSFSYFAFCTENNPVVEINDGKVKGVYLESRGGREFSAFMGIPYGQEPKRFEIAKPVSPWSGTLEATDYGSVCTQFDIRVQSIVGEEDCLFLNVFTPDVKRHLPVLVFFHGGGFQFGNSNENGPNYLMDEDVVFVTLNYRLGAFGFLSMGDETLPGNLGLKDQNLALKWIQANIERFGGNPKAVTIFGESAGGASVSYHVLSPQSLGLFQSAICISGTALNGWAFKEYPQKTALELANRLKCSTSTSLEIKNCLEQKTILDIYTPDSGDNVFLHLPHVPTIERNGPHAFLTESPKELYKKGNFAKIPLLVVATKDEGLLVSSAEVMKNPPLMKAINENWLKVAPGLFYYDDPTYSQETKDQISKAVKAFYFGENLPASKSMFQNLTDLFSDSGFIYASRVAALAHGRHASTYNGILEFNGTWSFIFFFGYDKVLGMSHADDLQYVFSNERFPEFLPNSDTLMASKRLVKTYTNFATYGDPNIDQENKSWKSLSVDEIESGEVNWMYLRNTEQHNSKVPLDKRMEFWDDISNLIGKNERVKIEL